MVVSASQQCEVWEVIGGGDAGGILVRSGKDLTSTLQPSRLARGARVQVLEMDAEAGRAQYQLLDGTGPTSGWVSTAVRGVELLAKAEPQLPCQKQQLTRRRLSYVRGGGRPRCGGSKLGRSLATPQTRPTEYIGGGANNESTQDSDGEQSMLCPQCSLPLGEMSYWENDECLSRRRLVHAECKASIVQATLAREERSRRDEQASAKKALYAKYGIGWSPDYVPSNAALAGKLASCPAPTPMSGLALTDSRGLRVCTTRDPAACVNLEYLSLALRARVREGREPFFSLDRLPAEIASADAWQVKRFEPQWMEGTSVGEVMFQADYYLKAASMGEYSQPVFGMKDCLDFLEEDPAANQEWNAREWFVVKKASVSLSQDGLLVPRVSMGVEAREQVQGPEGLEDARITQPSHPLVKYAEHFSNYFDLIAERKSVVYHLRALAKATVLAKYLVDSHVRLEEGWLMLAGEARVPKSPSRIPQVWNTRCSSRMRVSDGRIEDADSCAIVTRGLYGGVQFSLDQLRMAVPSAAGASAAAGPRPAAPAAAVMAAPGAPTAAPMPQVVVRSGPQLVSKVPTGPVLRPFGPGATAQRKALSTSGARGVDFNLDTFNLSELDLEQAFTEKLLPPAGQQFWQLLQSPDGSAASWPASQTALWRDVFNQGYHDRREEGDEFVPPDPHPQHRQKLRNLVDEEMAARGPKALDWERTVVNAQPLVNTACETIEAESIVRVIGFVEHAHGAAGSRHHFYTSLELCSGDVVVTELQSDGTVSWQRNPSGLQARNDAARVLRSSGRLSSGLKMSELKSSMESGDELYRTDCRTVQSAGKRHALRVYHRVVPPVQGEH